MRQVDRATLMITREPQAVYAPPPAGIKWHEPHLEKIGTYENLVLFFAYDLPALDWIMWTIALVPVGEPFCPRDPAEDLKVQVLSQVRTLGVLLTRSGDYVVLARPGEKPDSTEPLVQCAEAVPETAVLPDTDFSTPVRVVVACANSQGVPDFFFCKVKCSPAQYDNGDHYDAAIELAKAEGYEGPGFVAFDEGDGPTFLFEHFEWRTASVVDP